MLCIFNVRRHELNINRIETEISFLLLLRFCHVDFRRCITKNIAAHNNNYFNEIVCDLRPQFFNLKLVNLNMLDKKAY